MNDKETNKVNRGPFFMFLSASLFALGGLLLKYIPLGGMAVNGARTILAAVVLAIYMIIIRHPFKFNLTVLLGAVCITGTTILYCLANRLTTAGNTIILQFTMPVYVILFSLLFLHVKPTKLDIITCAAVFAGVLFFFIDGLSAGNMPGNILALLSGITYAGVFMMASSEKSDSLSSTILGMIMSAAVGLPFLLKEDIASMPASSFAVLLAAGIIQLGCGYICLNLGLATTSPTAGSLISGIEPILNPTLVAIFYGEKLSPMSLVGGAVVLAAIISYNYLKAKGGKQ